MFGTIVLSYSGHQSSRCRPVTPSPRARRPNRPVTSSSPLAAVPRALPGRSLRHNPLFMCWKVGLWFGSADVGDSAIVEVTSRPPAPIRTARRVAFVVAGKTPGVIVSPLSWTSGFAVAERSRDHAGPSVADCAKLRGSRRAAQADGVSDREMLQGVAEPSRPRLADGGRPHRRNAYALWIIATGTSEGAFATTALFEWAPISPDRSPSAVLKAWPAQVDCRERPIRRYGAPGAVFTPPE